MAAIETLTSQIKTFVPDDSVDIVTNWIAEHKVTLTITDSRKSVFGDYRWPQGKQGHRISVNGDLNKYAFLITFVHEMAHLTAWEKFRNTVSSHGKEWKQEFKILMDEFSGRKIFPGDITHAFKRHLVAPSYSHCEDPQLMKALRKYDRMKGVHLEDVMTGTLFRFEGRIFRKGEKLRKRIKCIEQRKQKVYLFNPVAEVEMIHN